MSQDEVLEDKESLARAHLPYRAEYCKTSRAKCKKCSENMDSNSMKLAVMTKSRFHDGYDAMWHHPKCFFQVKRPESIAEIRHFESLKYEDQKRLEEAIETNGLSILGTSVKAPTNSKSKSKKSSKREVSANEEILVNYDDFQVEYAKSNRSKCVSCEEKIDKGAVRFGKLDYSSENTFHPGPVHRWYHMACFAKSMEKLGFFGDVKKVKGFRDLDKSDRADLKDKIKPPKVQPCVVKKIKSDEVDDEEENILKKQSDRIFRYRENVSSMHKRDIEQLLEENRQKSNFKSPSNLIDAATDMLCFGAFGPCPKCNDSSGIVLRGNTYICTKVTEPDSCNYETTEPKRNIVNVPEDVYDKYAFFGNYKFKIAKRVFPKRLVEAIEKKEAFNNNIVPENAPLSNISLGVISWSNVGFSKEKVQSVIMELGGRVSTSIDRELFAILSNEVEYSKDAPKIEVAKALDIPFAKADFLFDIKTRGDVVQQLSKNIIGTYELDLQARYDSLSSKVKHEV